MRYKTIFFTVVFLFAIYACFNSNALAVPIDIHFVYTNGADASSQKDKEFFINGINKAHKNFKYSFESNPLIKKNVLKNGTIPVSSTAEPFYWGTDSQDAFAHLNDKLITLKTLSPKIAQGIRAFIAKLLHDAIWVQKQYNMQKIIFNLHKQIKCDEKNGHKVVLFGYSAGSFITYRYLFQKLPAIEPEKIVKALEVDYDGNIDSFYRENIPNATCVDALSASNIAMYSDDGYLVYFKDSKQLKNNYRNLNKFTNQVCTSSDELLGVVNYGSPIALFYSDILEPKHDVNKYNADLYKYIKDNDMFFLTVNFNDDPLGFPLGKNLTISEIEGKYNINFDKNGRGVFYSKSNFRSPATFLGAHISYWKYSKKVAKAIEQAYEEGYTNFYGK